MHERFDAGRVRDELAGGGITHVSLVPTMLRPAAAGLEGAGLRALLLGGGPIPADQLAASTCRSSPPTG